MQILVTGFGPFPGVVHNLSQHVVQGLPAVTGDVNILSHILPTEYEASGLAIESLLTELRPDICICTGVAPGINLRLEVLARNACSSEFPDQAGAVRRGPIKADGPEAYRSTLPLDEIESALTGAGHAVDRSEDAGGYVCNFVFYRARYTIERRELQTACGFLHLPALAPPGMQARQLDEIRGAVEILVRVKRS